MEEPDKRTEDNQEPNKPNEGRPFLMILMQADGSIMVKGHIEDKILAYGLLESARDAIKANMEKQIKIQNVNASGGLIQHLRNGFGR